MYGFKLFKLLIIILNYFSFIIILLLYLINDDIEVEIY